MKTLVSTILTTAALALALPAFAEPTPKDLSLDTNNSPQRKGQNALLPADVLANSAERFPDILESLAKQRAAQSDQITAQGAFDLVFKSDGYDRTTGFWDGSILKTELRQNLRPLGAQVYGSYRISDGTFPVYEDINFTNTGGEFKVGALLSLLRDRAIDQRRFKLEDTRLASAQASLEVLLTRVGVQQKALNAYWRWVAAGRELAVYQNLLAIAQARAEALEQQVEKGDQARVAITENLQNIIRREILVTEAQRNFTVAGNALSFYLRDQNGTLITPTRQHMPLDGELGKLASFNATLHANPGSVLQNRPELRTLRVALDRARNQVRLRKNDLKPSLDLNLEVSRDFGAVAEGGISRDSTDTVIGFSFSVPLQRRQARGRLQRANAELEALQRLEQRTEDQISIELNNILTNLTTALRLATLAQNEVVQAEQMVEVERERFALGASDFFLVNVREQRAADAEIRAIRADLNGRLARTSYHAATMNMAELGL